jgi:hypothetical protein
MLIKNNSIVAYRMREVWQHTGKMVPKNVCLNANIRKISALFLIGILLVISLMELKGTISLLKLFDNLIVVQILWKSRTKVRLY